MTEPAVGLPRSPRRPQRPRPSVADAKMPSPDPIDHMREPSGDVLVSQHVEQFQVGAVGSRPDPVPGTRPAERRVQQRQLAGGDHHLVHCADAQALA